MQPLDGPEALERLTGAVRRDAPAYSTNLFAPREQIAHWAASGRLAVLAQDDALIFLRAERDFHHVYHAARDLSALTAALGRLPAGRYTTDLIGRGEGLDQLADAYAAAGFCPHAVLCRMARSQPAATPAAPGAAEAATSADADAVAAFLDRLLDPLAEQLPDRDELAAAAAAGRLLVARRADAIIGMLLFDRAGQVAHLRFWHVDPAAHGQGIGRRLMMSFLSLCADARRIVLWVMGDNARSIAIYRHYGFETDGLVDRIMVLEKEERQ